MQWMKTMGLFSDMDDFSSPDLADERKTWRVDDHKLESDETAEEKVKEKRKKHLKKGRGWETGCLRNLLTSGCESPTKDHSRRTPWM